MRSRGSGRSIGIASARSRAAAVGSAAASCFASGGIDAIADRIDHAEVSISYRPHEPEPSRFQAGCGAVYASGSTPVHALAKLGEKLAARLERHAETARAAR